MIACVAAIYAVAIMGAIKADIESLCSVVVCLSAPLVFALFTHARREGWA